MISFGLPVGVRDVIQNEQKQQSEGNHSIVGQRYHYASLQEALRQEEEAGELDAAGPWAAEAPSSASLHSLSQRVYSRPTVSTAFRNLPKLCSFWLQGKCSRVLRGTCPYRPCDGSFAFPEIAGTDECKSLVQRLQREGPAAVQRDIDPITRANIQQALKGNRDESIRKRANGDDPLSRKYLQKMQESERSDPLAPPLDLSVRTLWLGQVEEDVSEQELAGVIYPLGQYLSLYISRKARCAFVEFVDRETAERAAKAVPGGQVVLRGRGLSIRWARSRDEVKPEVREMATTWDGTYHSMLPPPGLEQAPPTDYSLNSRPRQSRKRPGDQLHDLPSKQPALSYPSMDPARLGFTV